MIKKGNQPISGGAGQFRPTPNVLTRANRTSSDAQKLASASASPFQNPRGQLNIPARSVDGSRLGIPYTVARPVNARTVNLGAKPMSHAAMMAATGYGANATASKGPIISGYPTQGVNRVIGNGNFPRATAGMKKKYPGIFGSGR